MLTELSSTHRSIGSDLADDRPTLLTAISLIYYQKIDA